MTITKNDIHSGCDWWSSGQPQSIVTWVEDRKYEYCLTLLNGVFNRMLWGINRHNCVIISASKNGNSDEQNRHSNDRLEAWLMLHYDTIMLESYVMDTRKPARWQCQLKETALFASNARVDGDDGGEMFQRVARVAKHFGQESFFGSTPPNTFHSFKESYPGKDDQLIPDNAWNKIENASDVEKLIKTYMGGLTNAARVSTNVDSPINPELKIHGYRCTRRNWIRAMTTHSAGKRLDAKLFGEQPPELA